MAHDYGVDGKTASQWMRECLALARQAASVGGYAVGAVVARPGDGILGRSGSGLIAGTDPTGHPEISALRAAAETEGSRYIPGAYLVSTLEPCVMCTGAAVWARLAGIVYGASQSDAVTWSSDHPDPLYTWRQIRISSRAVVEKGDPVLSILDGVLRHECRSLFGLNRRSC
jgi:tRNA(adenine34) deaminase